MSLKIKKPIKNHEVRQAKKQTGGSSLFDLFKDLPRDAYLYAGESNELVTEQTLSSLDFTGKTIGTITGCFCPPHKGHYEMIFEACRNNQLDMLFLRTINRADIESSRHGIPVNVSLTLLALFAKYIHHQLGTHIFISYGLDVPMSLPATVKQVIYIDVIELSGPPTSQDIANARALESRDFLAGKTRNFLRNFDRSNNTKVVMRILFRNKSTDYSATKFVRTIHNAIEAVASYLPDDIPTLIKYDMIGDLIKEYGIYLH